ncbi:MAG: ABC transporter permease [Bacteroidales bacterium]|mgnify:FL=1|nr:ABC transporter permease [Bacteroidales bacterium]
MLDLFREIFASISHNKMRFLLTGVSIGWGIFLLIVLLGAGNGLYNGITAAWIDESDNILSIAPSKTMLPFNGHDKGRKIEITENDAYRIARTFEENVRVCVPELDTAVLVSAGTHFSMTDIAGFYPGFNVIKNNILIAGRKINDSDIEQERKVCVVSVHLCDRLFPREKPEGIVGREIRIYDVNFTVVGVYTPKRSYNITRTIYAPFSTVRSLWFRDDKISKVSYILEGLNTVAANDRFKTSLREWLAYDKDFDPADQKAVNVDNSVEFYLQVQSLFGVIKIFLWIVGLSTLVAGVVGISNIMLITVKERTRELAVRKAMGASSRSILTLVLTESVAITVLFGYIGMILGLWSVRVADIIVNKGVSGPSSGSGAAIFLNPSVEWTVILGATLIMVIAGLLAGYAPAKTAMRLRLVEALASPN